MSRYEDLRIYEDLRGAQSRLGLLQTALVLIMLLLGGYFWHLQVVRGSYYRELADNNRIRAVRIAAPRGTVFDRHGHVLIDNRPSFNIVLTPEDQDLQESLQRMAEILRTDQSSLNEDFAPKGRKVRSIIIKADATLEDVAAIEARRRERPEATVEVVPLRSYPLAAAASHVLGRVGEVTDRQQDLSAFKDIEPGSIVGQEGIEYQYNRKLMGRDGHRRVIVNSRGVEVREEEREEPTPGPPANLTIDMELQRIAEDVMRGRSGAVAALDPFTGEILALTSMPGYDPNVFSSGVSRAIWNQLNKDPNKPLFNRVIQGQYAPGSTFKVLMGLAGLDSGVITPSTTFFCPGSAHFYGVRFRCWRAEGHGAVSYKRALQQSCDVYFYNVGVRLEIERIAKYARLTGFGQLTGVDLPHEMPGLVPDPEWKRRVQKQPWYAGETVSVAIGQGAVSVTPLQLARLAALVANGGKLVHPHIIKKIANQPVQYEQPTPLPFKAHHVALTREAMSLVTVPGGTAIRAKLKGVDVAGKTGTSQVVGSRRGESTERRFRPNAWFIAFAPADDPKIAIALLYEHGEHGSDAGALVGQILSRYLRIPLEYAPIVEPNPEEPLPPTQITSR